MTRSRASCALLALLGSVTLAPSALLAQSAPAPTVPAPILKVVADKHALALRADGTVIGWGRFRAGQLGEAPVLTSKRRYGVATPVPIALPGKVLDIAVGEDASYALLDNGTVYAWGANARGELGIGSTEAPALPNGERGYTAPQQVRELRDVMQIGAIRYSAFALLRDGTMRAWGSRDGGVIGDAVVAARWGETIAPATTPVAVQGVRDVRQFSAAGGHVVALTSDGRIYAWGQNGSGELGTGAKSTSPLARPVEMARVPDVVSAVAGVGVTGFLKRDGTVWMVGSTVKGLFGIPEEQADANDGWSGTPRAVPGVRNVVALTMGDLGRHAIALLQDGTLRGWGNSDWGQVGNGVGGFFVWTPVIPKIAGVTAVWATGKNTFAVTRDGGFWIWGDELGGTGVLAVNQKLPVRFPLP
jgi:alpha-tubulin suppressor-like RCC1 family protein